MPPPHDPEPPEGHASHQGPAWTRVTHKERRARGGAAPVWPPQLRRSPASDPAIPRATTAGVNAATGSTATAHAHARPYGNAAAAAASTVSLPAQATPGNPPQRDAPYLTHVARHHGHLTLVAPDNLGARRQPGTRDPPDATIDARGSWGIPAYPAYPAAADDAPSELPPAGQAKIKKRSDRARKKEREERQRRERAVASAVANAGRTPSPSPTAHAHPLAPSSPTPPPMARGKSAASLEVPGQGEPQRRRKSRERPATTESRPASATAADPGAFLSSSARAHVSL